MIAAILISRKQTAIVLGISLGMVDKISRQGLLEPVRLGKKVMFRRSDVEMLALTPSQRRAMNRDCVGSVQ